MIAGPVLAVAGRRVDKAGAETARFAVGEVAVVAARIRAVLRELEPRNLLASAAAGSDLIALDAAIALSIPVRVLLPFDRDRFRTSSVSDRGPDWVAMYDEVLQRAEIEVLDSAGLSDAEAYTGVTRALVDRARAADRGAVALAVWDLKPREPVEGEVDQSEQFVRYARQRGLRIVEVTTRNEDELPWQRTVFVAMPFAKKVVEGHEIDFDSVYRTILRPGIQSAGTPDGLPFFPTRADEGLFSGIIDEIMYRRLESSRICLADVTGQNPNVMIELGVRYHASPSGTIVLRQQLGSLPFDMTHVRALPYDPADVVGAREFVARVIDESARANVVDSPVRAAIAALPASSEPAHPSALVLSLMREAEEALARGKESVAFDRYESVLREYADSEVHVRAAALAVRLERYAAALSHCAAAIRIDENNGAAYREQGVALERQHPGSGIDSLKCAVELTPNDYDAWSSLGGALRRQGRNAEALAAYQRAVTISNGDPYPLLNALKLKKLAGGDADLREQGFLRAAARLRRADIGDPRGPRDVPWSYFDLAEIERFLGNDATSDQLLRDGADLARLSQLESHRNAIAPLAAATGDPSWVAAVAYLDQLISAARGGAGDET